MRTRRMNLENWIANREHIGKPSFSRNDVAVSFPGLVLNAIDSSLSRCWAKGLIAAVHRGYYCVMPAHYALSGQQPPQGETRVVGGPCPYPTLRVQESKDFIRTVISQ